MSDIAPVFAFTTISAKGLLNRLTNNVLIEYENKAYKAIALWDTGATGTCISAEVVKALGLVPSGNKNIQTPSGQSQVNTYLVNVILPNNVRIPDVEVCDSEIGNQGIGVLIGMDIISMGDFAVSNYKGTSMFTFRIPSQSNTDYVVQLKIKNQIGSHGKGKRKHKRN